MKRNTLNMITNGKKNVCLIVAPKALFVALEAAYKEVIDVANLPCDV